MTSRRLMKASRVALKAYSTKPSFFVLSKTILDAVKDGNLTGERIEAENLWNSPNPTVLFCVRRPGWALCREEGRALSDLQLSGRLGNARLYGIIKEVAPTKTAPSDEELGVKIFQEKYFPYPLYRNEDLSFFSFLGNRSLLSQIPWNPLKWFSRYQNMKHRLADKNIKGNMTGEGLTLGGLYSYIC